MRAIAILSAIAMVASLFLPWLRDIGSFTPWDLVRNVNPDLQTAQDFVTSSPVQMLIFLASFVLAGLFAVLAIIGLPLRLLAMGAGGAAVGLIAWGAIQVRDLGGQGFGLPLGANFSTTDILRLAGQALNIGAWAWSVGAGLLFLTALVGYNRR